MQRWLGLWAGVAAFFAAGGTAAAQATPFVDIASTGPLTHIIVGNDLSCQIAFLGDDEDEYFPSDARPGDCGTFFDVGGVLYAPDFENHEETATGAIGDRTPWTPVSQTRVTGIGDRKNPFTVVTVVRAAATGIEVRQTDRYVRGDAAVRTDVEIVNNSRAAITGNLYRAGDCYLQESDYGFGFIDDGRGISCARTARNLPPARIEQWLPISSGAHIYEAHYRELWRWIGTGRSFPDRCRCDDRIDNAAGLSWRVTVPAGRTVRRAHFVTFSRSGVTGGPRSNDRQAPDVVMSGIPEACITRGFFAGIYALDASPLRSVRVTLDGRLVRRTTRPVFRVPIRVHELSVGRHRLAVRAVDRRGNRSTTSRSFRRCIGPRFTG